MLFILLLVILGFVFFLFNQNVSTGDSDNKMDENVPSATERPDLFGEDLDENKHDLKLTIISPEEETFIPRQARYYNALAEGNYKWSNQVKCKWEFYLNQNNEEALYETMDNSGILSGETKEVCGFTPTFIEDVGVLRVKLSMTVYNAVDDNLETVTAERIYTVK